ncbi:hypothetical protein ACLB2K_066250 [Fragaria x ananassa]
MLVNDVPGVLNIVTGVISRRGYNIQLSSSFYILLRRKGFLALQLLFLVLMTQLPSLVQQLRKSIDIHEAQDITHLPFAERELMLIKIAVNASASRDVLHIAGILGAKAGDVSDHNCS